MPSLSRYNQKRDFKQTPEPAGVLAPRRERLSFVVQKHAARRLHYDFRLELDGTLKSWAVPKGPSLDPSDKRMAVEVEDHPLSYADFEGTIPPGHYGAGSVIVWDRGTWTPLGDARKGYRAGKLKFELHGDKLRGGYTLVRMRKRDDERQTAWLLIKERDEHARASSEYDVVEAMPDSVLKAPRSAAKHRKAVPPAQPLPLSLAPQLATLVSQIPPGDDWLYEIKFDGYRLLTRVDGDDVRCYTRNGNDWSSKLPGLVSAVKKLGIASAWLDGEIVVMNQDAIPDFQALQNAFDARNTHNITYYLFDLPFCNGRDLRDEPLHRRRAALLELLGRPQDGPLRYSESFDADPKTMLASARQVGLEGLIGKRRDSLYRSERTRDWIKLKTGLRQEFVIGGYTDPQGSRIGIGSLLLGVHDEHGQLRYVGNVGTGFDERTLSDLRGRLDKLRSDHSPFTGPVERERAGAAARPHWVRPSLLGEVSFGQWTRGGHIRHSVFEGLRSDKPAQHITQEAPAAPAKRAPKLPPKMRVTHAERVIDAASGITKGELIAFYARVAKLMLPHLKQRPVSLVRAPQGVGGELFFQKHAQGREIAHVDVLDRALYPSHEPLLQISSEAGLLSAAQMNVIEFHTWNATTGHMDRPDRMVFDLDPGQGVAWPQVQQAAALVHALLDELGLKSFLKTSGGKGLHVVVPLTPRDDGDAVKACSQAIVAHLARIVPQRFVAKSGPKNRVGRIFVDYLRNGLGATTAAAWSARARASLGVSVPVAWDELDGLRSAAQWTVSNVDPRLAVGNQPWAGYARVRQDLRGVAQALDADAE